jgi:hypothetical protein
MFKTRVDLHYQETGELVVEVFRSYDPPPRCPIANLNKELENFCDKEDDESNSTLAPRTWLFSDFKFLYSTVKII